MEEPPRDDSTAAAATATAAAAMASAAAAYEDARRFLAGVQKHGLDLYERLRGLESAFEQWRQSNPGVDRNGEDYKDFEDRIKELKTERADAKRDLDAAQQWLGEAHQQLVSAKEYHSARESFYLQLSAQKDIKRSGKYVFGIDKSQQDCVTPYQKVAETLKDVREVAMLDAEIKRIRGMPGVPFIVLESSSGMGKTQMAFNLMARGESQDDLEVFYLVCEEASELHRSQNVYSAFRSRSSAFLCCLAEDLKLSCDGAVGAISSLAELHTLGFIRALLTGDTAFVVHTEDRSDVEALIASRKRQCVFFLDEFPNLPKEEDSERVRKLRFMRNVFRSLGLVVILSSTNGTARNLIKTGASSRGSDERSPLWCVVFPSLPRFQADAINAAGEEVPPIDKRFRAIIFNSRPLFAKRALAYIRRSPMITGNFVEYMDDLVGELGDSCLEWKANSSWFRAGQLCLFLCTSFVADERSNLINGHFARLEESERFDLNINSDFQLLKNTKPWQCHCKFPPASEDILLYLALTGGKKFRALFDSNKEALPFCKALDEVDKDTRVLNFDNTNQHSNDGMRLEAIVAGSIVLASHVEGFSGSEFAVFFSALLYELGIRRTPNERFEFPSPIEDVGALKIPFLAPPNVEGWPAFLPSELTNSFAELNRATNDSRLDFQVSNCVLSGECKDYGKRLPLKVMRDVVERIPASSKLHLVITNELQASYFTQTDFDTFITKGAPSLKKTVQHTYFYRIGRNDNTLKEVKGIKNKCRSSQCTSSSCKVVDKLVIFMELK